MSVPWDFPGVTGREPGREKEVLPILKHVGRDEK